MYLAKEYYVQSMDSSNKENQVPLLMHGIYGKRDTKGSLQ